MAAGGVAPAFSNASASEKAYRKIGVSQMVWWRRSGAQ